MNSGTFIAAFLPVIILFIIFFSENRNKKAFVMKHIISKNKAKENAKMVEIAREFIKKDCIIYTLNSQLSGVIANVRDNAILLDNGKNMEIINLDYVIRIREFPKGKNGKRKSVVLD